MSKRLEKGWRPPTKRLREVYWSSLEFWHREALSGYDVHARRRGRRNVERIANVLGLTELQFGPRGGVTGRALYKTRGPGARVYLCHRPEEKT